MTCQNSSDHRIQSWVRLPLRFILMIIFSVQIFAAVGVTGWLSWRNHHKIANQVADQWIDQVAARVEEKLSPSTMTDDRVSVANSPVPMDRESKELTVSEIRTLIQSLNVTEFSQVAIIESSGKIVTSSLPTWSGQNDAQVASPSQRLIESAIESLQSHHSGLSNVNQSQLYSFTLNGQGHFYQVRAMPTDRNLDWFLLVVIPDSSLMEPITSNIQMTIVLGIGLFALAIASGFTISKLITQPIRQMSEASQAIGQGDFQPIVLPTVVKELGILGDNFQQMSHQLHKSFQELTAKSEALSQELSETHETVEQERHDRHIVEQQLHTSEQKMRAFFTAMNDIIIILDTDGNLEMAPTNPGVLYSPDTDIIGLTIEYLYEDDRFQALQEKLERVLATQKTINFDYSLMVDEQKRWFAARISPVSEKSAIWVARDISDRKEAELALHFAQQETENLLLNILPKTIAEQLKKSPEAIAEHFDEVSILFSDIVGFTPLSARLSPIELVQLLNEMFSRFDRLAETYKLEKIKTIGDAYMVAAGLPLHRDDHAIAIANMAIDMQTCIKEFSSQYREEFQIRIGIHSGPVVAGVIGTKKFIYDLWGDTVNVASRMESSGIPGKIQITSDTYEFLKHDSYILEERGQIAVKGKGDMITYWLIDRR
jgi:PAS domain S-box-containing protein